MIKHYPILKTQQVIDKYSESEGCDILYVCTTDLTTSDVPVDIFYRTGGPHPEFGNQYFGLFQTEGSVFITDADMVCDFIFSMIKVGDTFHYSQSRHDYKMIGMKMIDGGRQYVRSNCSTFPFQVKDGVMERTYLVS